MLAGHRIHKRCARRLSLLLAERDAACGLIVVDEGERFLERGKLPTTLYSKVACEVVGGAASQLGLGEDAETVPVADGNDLG